jgi:predicted glutamine amidotransferase
MSIIASIRGCASCRWALYASTVSSGEIAAADLLVATEHSLAIQSHSEPFIPYQEHSDLWDSRLSTVRNHRCNRDGWGLAWLHSENGDGNSGSRGIQVHRSPEPATTQGTISNELRDFATNTSGQMILAHVRAATEGANAIDNSHPFMYHLHVRGQVTGQIAWMHNGGIKNIEAVRKHILPRLASHASDGIQGTTVRAARGRLSAISVFLCKSVLYGAFVWARRALKHQKRRFPARAGQRTCWCHLCLAPRGLCLDEGLLSFVIFIWCSYRDSPYKR